MLESQSIPARSSSRATDTSVSLFATPWQRILDEAKLYWPRDTAKKLSGITGRSPRTCYRWYSKRHRQPPKSSELLAIVAAMRAEWSARGKMFEQFEFDLH